MHSPVIRLAALGISIAGLACATIIPSAGADPAAARVVDATFSCAVKPRAGARRLDVTANAGFRDPAQTRWRWLSYASARNQDWRTFFWLYAGSPPPQGRDGASTLTRWLGVDPQLCKRSSAAVGLSPRALQGGSASVFQSSDVYECPSSPAVLLRVRAEFAKPAVLRAQQLNQRRWLMSTAGTPVVKGSVAIIASTRKPIAYATVSEAGKATLFTAPSCVPD